MEAGKTTMQLTIRCRKALGQMAHGHSIRAESVSPDVREALESRGLVAEHTEGLLRATSRAAGYTHAPETFEV